jgi:hypothetical protein
MPKINKEFTITFDVKEANAIFYSHILEKYDLKIDEVFLNIKPLSDDRGNYAGQEVDKIICKGKTEE